MRNRKLFFICSILFFVLISLIPQILNADPLDHWHFRDSLTNRTISSITYGNGIFVAVTDAIADEILTSPDGAIWTKKKFVNTLYGVTYGNGIFVAVGDDCKIYTSLDGIDWEERYSGPGTSLNEVGYGNGIFVAVGWDSLVTSFDGGMTWIRAGTPTDLRGVTYGNGLFVAVGKWGTVLTSPDGINWALHLVNSRFGYTHLNGVAYGNGTFVAVGSDSAMFPHGMILTSNDAVNWRGIIYSRGNFTLDGVTYANDTFVVVGTGGTIFTSPDGAEWEVRNSNTSKDLKSVAFGNYTFITVGQSGVILQSDPTGPEVISPPSIISGPTEGLEKVSYSYSTGGSSSNLGHPVQYLFDWGDGTNSGWLPVGTASASKPWPSAGIYTVRAQARCANHTSILSSWTEPLSITIYSPPSPLTNIQASDGIYMDKVEVSWAASPGATSYTIYRATSLARWVRKTLLGTTSGTFFNDTTAVPKITYYYWVTASNAYGTSNFSPYDAGYRSDGSPPAPTNISASDGMYVDRVEVTWSASSGATSYTVYRATSFARWVRKAVLGTTSETTFNDSTATPGRTYYYWVKAANTYGTSNFSAYDSGYR